MSADIVWVLLLQHWQHWILKFFFSKKCYYIYICVSASRRSKFAEIFNNKMNDKTHRIYIDGDLVPKIPTTLNLPGSYKHVDKKFILQNSDLNINEKHRINYIINTIGEMN